MKRKRSKEAAFEDFIATGGKVTAGARKGDYAATPSEALQRFLGREEKPSRFPRAENLAQWSAADIETAFLSGLYYFNTKLQVESYLRLRKYDSTQTSASQHNRRLKSSGGSAAAAVLGAVVEATPKRRLIEVSTSKSPESLIVEAPRLPDGCRSAAKQKPRRRRAAKQKPRRRSAVPRLTIGECAFVVAECERRELATSLEWKFDLPGADVVNCPVFDDFVDFPGDLDAFRTAHTRTGGFQPRGRRAPPLWTSRGLWWSCPRNPAPPLAAE